MLLWLVPPLCASPLLTYFIHSFIHEPHPGAQRPANVQRRGRELPALSTPTEAPGTGPARVKVCRGPLCSKRWLGLPDLTAAPSHACEWRAGGGVTLLKNISHSLHEADLVFPFAITAHSHMLWAFPSCGQFIFYIPYLSAVHGRSSHILWTWGCLHCHPYLHTPYFPNRKHA